MLVKDYGLRVKDKELRVKGNENKIEMKSLNIFVYSQKQWEEDINIYMHKIMNGE